MNACKDKYGEGELLLFSEEEHLKRFYKLLEDVAEDNKIFLQLLKKRSNQTNNA